MIIWKCLLKQLITWLQKVVLADKIPIQRRSAILDIYPEFSFSRENSLEDLAFYANRGNHAVELVVPSGLSVPKIH